MLTFLGYGLLVVALLSLCFGVGRRALSSSDLDFADPVDDVVFSVAVGMGVVATVLLGLGFAGLLQRWILGTLWIVGLLLIRRELRVGVRTGRAVVAELWPETAWLRVLAGIVVPVGVAFLFTQAVLPVTDWDSLMYHVEIPVRFLEFGRILVPEDNLHVAFVGLFHLLYVPLLAFGGPPATALLSAATALLLSLSVYAAGRRLLGKRIGVLAALLLWATTPVLLVAITPRVDVSVAWLLLLCHYALLAALTEPDLRRHVLVAAALAGFAVGAKLNALPYLAGLAPLALWVWWKRGRSGTGGGATLFLAAAGIAVLCALPWFAKNWVLLNAPFYPFAAERTVPAWLAALFPGGEFPASLDMPAFRALSQVREPLDIVRLFFSPGTMTVEGEGAQYFFNPLLLFLPLALLLRDRTWMWLAVPALAYVGLVYLRSPTTNLRYLIPAIPPLTLVVAATLVQLSARLRPRFGTLVLLLVTSLALAPSAGTALLWTVRRADSGYLTGATSADRYLAANGHGLSRAFVDVVRFANEELPPDARILMILEARGYYFEPTVLQDNLLTNWPLLLATGSPESCLASADVSHVLVSTVAATYYHRRGLKLETLRWPALQRFAARCLRPVHEVPGYTLFRLDSRAGAGE